MVESLIEWKWKTSEQADRVLAQYRKFVSDVKQYHEKFVSFRVGKDRLGHFLYEELTEKREAANFVSWPGFSREGIFS